jgi:hypothetical protein
MSARLPLQFALQYSRYYAFTWSLFAVNCCAVVLPLQLCQLQDPKPEVVGPLGQLKAEVPAGQVGVPTGPINFQWV